MEAAHSFRSSLLGSLLLLVKVSVLLIQNRVHLYNFLLLKIIDFNHWLLGLAQEAQGPCGQQVPPLPGLTTCPVGRALRAGLALIEVPMWLVLQMPRLVWVTLLGYGRVLSLAPQRLGAWERPGLPAATWTELLLSCLHSLLLTTLLLLLLTWRLCRRAHRCSLGWLPHKALLQTHVMLRLLAPLKCLYWWVQGTVALASWHLAYLVTWTTCLASHLLQAAFEHTAQLAQAQETEPHEVLGPLFERPLPEPLVPEAGQVLTEHGNLRK